MYMYHQIWLPLNSVQYSMTRVVSFGALKCILGRLNLPCVKHQRLLVVVHQIVIQALDYVSISVGHRVTTEIQKGAG